MNRRSRLKTEALMSLLCTCTLLALWLLSALASAVVQHLAKAR